MNDRLQLKKDIALKLQKLLESADQNLLPEEKAISLGPSSISRKLGEFIATPSMSEAWDYEALNKLDGPKLYRTIAGAWDAGHRSGGGKLLIQPGAGKTTVTTQTGPFAGGERTVADTRPGSRVHHKVAIASIFRPIEKLPLDRQIDLIEALYERGFMVGNDPSNLISLLDYTHEYAGDNAAHVWGDTVGLGYRPTITPDMTFEDQLDALIETSIKPQYRDLMRAVGPGTIEYSYQKQLQKTFQETIGKPVSDASVEEIKAFNRDVLKQRANLDYPARDPFDESLVDPTNRSTYDTYIEARNNQASGLPANFKPLKGSERLELDRKARLTVPINTKAFLNTVAGEELPPGKSSAKTLATKQVQASSALKMGYPVEYAAGLGTDAYSQLRDVVKSNGVGLAAGSLLDIAGDKDTLAAIDKGDYGTAGLRVGTAGLAGALVEQGIKKAVSLAPAGGVLRLGFGSALKFAGPIGLGVSALDALNTVSEHYTGENIADQASKFYTGKDLAQHTTNIKQQISTNLSTASAAVSPVVKAVVAKEKPIQIAKKAASTISNIIPKPLNPANEALYIGRSLMSGKLPYFK